MLERSFVVYFLLSITTLTAAHADGPLGAFAALNGDASLDRADRWFSVRASATGTPSGLSTALAALGSHRIAVSDKNGALLLVELDNPSSDLPAAMRALEATAHVAWAQAGVHTPDGGALGLTDAVMVLGEPEPALLTAHQASVRKALPFGDGVLVALAAPTRARIMALCNAIRATGIEAHPNFLRMVDKRKTLNDPYLSNQWYLSPIEALKAWDTTTGSSQVIVAVIDDGFDMVHEDYAAKIVSAYDFGGNDDWPAASSWEDHGTAVAGVAIAIGNNGKGVAGVCPACSFMPVKQGQTDYSIVAAFAHVGDKGAHVVNNSWGFYYPSQTIQNAITGLSKNGRGGKGTMVVFASGNENQNIDAVQDISATDGAVSVAAATQWDTKANYSNWGKSIDIGAPADGQYTTDKTQGGYSNGAYTGSFGGTSGASPVVAGAAGLIFSLDPNMTETTARNLMLNSAEKVGGGYGSNGKSTSFGYGRLNVAKAIALYDGEPVVTDPLPNPDPTDPPAGGECQGVCGGQGASGCWCDGECAQYGDCCADACDSCGFDCGDNPGQEPQPDPVQPEPTLSCSSYFDCANGCQTQSCLDQCQEGVSAEGVQAANAVMGCLQNSGCYSAQTQQQFQNCASQNCQSQLLDCFEPTQTEPEPEPEPDPVDPPDEPGVEPDPVDDPGAGPETPDEPTDGPVPVNPVEEPAASEGGGSNPGGDPIELKARNKTDGCSSSSASSNRNGVLAIMALCLLGLWTRRRAF